MALPVHLDAPLDYRELWQKLRVVLNNCASNEAVRAATAKDEPAIRKAQGAYEFALRAVSIMDRLVQDERSSETVFDEDANETEH